MEVYKEVQTELQTATWEWTKAIKKKPSGAGQHVVLDGGY